jgi:hypothetical protein
MPKRKMQDPTMRRTRTIRVFLTGCLLRRLIGAGLEGPRCSFIIGISNHLLCRLYYTSFFIEVSILVNKVEILEHKMDTEYEGGGCMSRTDFVR